MEILNKGTVSVETVPFHKTSTPGNQVKLRILRSGITQNFKLLGNIKTVRFIILGSETKKLLETKSVKLIPAQC